MPPLASQRAAAVAVAALFAAAPLASTAAAYADPTSAPPSSLPPESGKEVVFSGGGGLLGVSCEANPSTSVVTVLVETTLQVVNRTGYRAKLLLDGATQGEIADGAAAPVVFHRGPVRLGLKPTCMLAGESSVRVEVVEAPRAKEPGGVKPGDSGRPAGGSRTTREARPAASTSARPEVSPSAVPRAPSEPGIAGEDGGDPAIAVDTVGGSTGAGAEGVAAEALSSVQPVRNSGPIGLLALIATVCVVGVAAGAIRAIIAQRATRTGVA